MTRKDYVAIAAALDNIRPRNMFNRDIDLGRMEGWRAAVYAVSGRMEFDNPRFDRERFLKACGVQS